MLRTCVRTLAIVLVTGLVAACGDTSEPAAEQTSSTGAADSTSESPIPDPTSLGDTEPIEPDSTGMPPSDDGEMGECSIWLQDCADGDKCVPWSELADLIPDEIRCCPVPDNAVAAGDECMVEDYFGSCLDNCAVGTFCMDINNDGIGVCQPFCSGDPGAPVCEPHEACLFYFAGVPICFSKCDPLVQDCQDDWGCYPDEEANGGTGFICLPTIIGSNFGGFCWLLSSCAPGLICVLPEFQPGCDSSYGCCTSLCDVTAPDTCSDFHPDLECVSWYYAGQEPPEAEWQNVGACVTAP